MMPGRNVVLRSWRRQVDGAPSPHTGAHAGTRHEAQARTDPGAAVWVTALGAGGLLKGTGASAGLSFLICEMGTTVLAQPTSREDDQHPNEVTDGKGSLRGKA